MRLLSSTGLALVLTTALVLPLPQQPALERRPLVSVKTDLVMLNVTVVDRHGVLVPGLTKDQFAVYDSGTRQPIALFVSEDLPATVGLLIDSSGSMRTHREPVTAAATAFAAFSHPSDQLFTVNFNDQVWPGLPPHVTFAEDVEQLRSALLRAPAVGKTALYDAMTRALDHLRLGTCERKALIVISDGGDNASSHTLDDVLQQARGAAAVIYAVALVDPDDRTANPGVLKKLARETGGDAFTPKRAQDVMAAFAQIAREIRSGYTIGFSPQGSPDEGFRPVRVVVDAGHGRQLTARTRAGYYAGTGRDPG